MQKKRCFHCRNMKTVDQYNKHPKYGLQLYCKWCERKYQKERYYANHEQEKNRRMARNAERWAQSKAKIEEVLKIKSICEVCQKNTKFFLRSPKALKESIGPRMSLKKLEEYLPEAIAICRACITKESKTRSMVSEKVSSSPSLPSMPSFNPYSPRK